MDAPISPIVSVLLCAYNAEAWLQEAIDSVLQQTFEVVL
jgi:glycosyltransferase involved in cell wall biosynthesis